MRGAVTCLALMSVENLSSAVKVIFSLLALDDVDHLLRDHDVELRGGDACKVGESVSSDRFAWSGWRRDYQL